MIFIKKKKKIQRGIIMQNLWVEFQYSFDDGLFWYNVSLNYLERYQSYDRRRLGHNMTSL